MLISCGHPGEDFINKLLTLIGDWLDQGQKTQDARTGGSRGSYSDSRGSYSDTLSSVTRGDNSVCRSGEYRTCRMSVSGVRRGRTAAGATVRL